MESDQVANRLVSLALEHYVDYSEGVRMACASCNGGSEEACNLALAVVGKDTLNHTLQQLAEAALFMEDAPGHPERC